ncbi:hypothetical protein O181_127055 [Austropuccinia psidii MF-1]|uniref:Uncharacterized protein n=1 Tax=Austropuccinia psidii MF-1 TaxID=1389203 RepID=A0A9Q3KSG6_9BASI|nr:hypothetical protein [Austropuccinia psidii MF-1]
MRLQQCSPISALTTPYASAPPPHLLLGLQFLHSCGALKLCVRCCPHPPLHSQCPPDMPPMPPHTSLILKAAYDPYAPAAPSR